MEIKLLNLAVSRLSDEIEKLRSELTEVKSELTKVKTTQPLTSVIGQTLIESEKNVLLDAKEVMNMLGISFNTLYKLVKQGLIKRIKINQRRIRYEKSSIKEYIEKFASYSV